jgi:multisubunit Na+/H+ antiporter MnhF subunit
MSKWEIAAAVLGCSMLPCMGVCVLTRATHALAALEVAGALLTSILMLLSEGFRRQPFIDLAVVFAVISMIGAIAFARLMEREL